MERPILTISTKDFLTGIAPSAHTERGGLFYSATGVTPVYDPGGSASVENGLLQAGPAPTNIGGATVVDTIIAACSGNLTTGRAFFLGDGGHLYQLLDPANSSTLSDLRSGTPITNPANGIALWAPQGGTRKLYYWQKTQIGTWDLSGSHPTGWTDNAYTSLSNVAFHPVHEFVGNLYYGNTTKVGALLDDGAAGVTHSTNVFDYPASQYCTAISDDGVYLVVATTENLEGVNVFAMNKIYFWDTYSSSWSRDYEIRDPFIWSLVRVGSLVYAFGQYGIYEVSFAGGVRKVLSRSIGFGTPADLIAGYGASRATAYNQEALIFGTDTTIDTFGSLSPDLPVSYLKPLKVPDGVGTPSLVFSLFQVGSVYVATDGDKLYRYDFNGATRETGVSAQTVYFPVPQRIEVDRIDVIFGEPLASGDAISLQLKTDEDTSATPTTALVASYTNDGAIRRKSVRVAKYFTEAPLSLVINFTAGAAKIKRIEIYGNATPVTQV